MKLKTKITTTIIAILLLAIGSISVLSFNQMKTMLKDQFGRNLLNIANSVSMSYMVQNYLSSSDQNNGETSRPSNRSHKS